MKYKKQVGAALVGSLALVSGVSAYQLYPRETEIEPISSVIREVEEERPVEEQPIEETLVPEVTNPTPLPASEPVVPEQTVVEEPVTVGCNNPTAVIMVNMDDTRWNKLTVDQTLPWGERISILTLYKNTDGRSFCLEHY